MKCLRNILGFTLLDKKRNEDILRTTGWPHIENELRKRRLQWSEHVQGMVVRGCRREFYDVDQWEEKLTGGSQFTLGGHY